MDFAIPFIDVRLSPTSSFPRPRWSFQIAPLLSTSSVAFSPRLTFSSCNRRTPSSMIYTTRFCRLDVSISWDRWSSLIPACLSTHRGLRMQASGNQAFLRNFFRIFDPHKSHAPRHGVP